MCVHRKLVTYFINLLKKNNEFFVDKALIEKYKKNKYSFLVSKSAKDYSSLPKRSLVRLKSRCYKTGFSRSYLRLFGMSRMTFRSFALAGLVPGVRKSSR